MSERKPDDVAEKVATVVHRFIQEHGGDDVRWHCGALLGEYHRARESEEAQAKRIAALEAELVRVRAVATTAVEMMHSVVATALKGRTA